MPSSPKRFSVSAKNFFLTYPRCSLSKESALEQLLSLSSTQTNKKFIRICREFHEDGEPHLHALIQFEGKFKCTNPRFFDLTSPTRSSLFHPNIQAAKSSSDVKSYIEKDGDFVDWGEFQIDPRSARGGKQTLAEVYAEALNAGSKSDALQVIKEKDPKSFFLQFHNICSNADRIFAPPPTIFVPKWCYSSFRIPDTIKRWVADNFECDSAARPDFHKGIRGGLVLRRDIDRPISLIIEGPSRTGKTAWARSIGRHNYLSGHLDFNPRVFSNGVDYNVIDDVAPNYLKLKHWKELIGAQHDWQSNCKYGKPVQIKGGVPAIVLCNPGEGSSYKDFLDKAENQALRDWTLHNAQFEFIQSPLYQKEAQDCQITHVSQA